MPPSESDASPTAPRAYPPGGPDAETQARLREKLLRMRSQLLRSNHDLVGEALKGSGQDFSIDHMADHASDNAEQEIAISLLEGETVILEAIEDAIRKIDGNHALPYGLCEACAEMDTWEAVGGSPWIPTGRLEAVPYARLCVTHQEEQEES